MINFRTECFCGNNEPNRALRLPDPNCNMKCPGDPKEACGGYFAINIYETGITSECFIALSCPQEFIKNQKILKN